MAGEHQVVWWDPSVLALGVERNFGLRQAEILGHDASGAAAAEGSASYRKWRNQRDRLLAEGGRARFDVAIVTELEEPPPDDGETPMIELEMVPRLSDRPGGKRFGTLVHTLLRDVDFDADKAAVGALAEMHGRMLDATSDEMAAAVIGVCRTLEHPLMRRAAAAERRHREAPFLLDLGQGAVVEGTIDLAFFENGTWIVIDFKTDADLTAREESYRCQLAWYVHALRTMTGKPAQGVLLGV